MELPQFFRMNGYGRTPQRKQPNWSCIAGITAEGARLHGACKHVAEPAPPVVLFGASPVEAGQIALERLAGAVDSIGRRLRSDAVALLAAVASYPVPRAIVEDPDKPLDRAAYLAWRSKALEWFQVRFGTALKSAVEHIDEGYLHLHAFIVPELGPDRRLNLAALHPGRAAVQTAIQAGEAEGCEQRIYKAAMAGMQDEYHKAVSLEFGHARVGPQRQRRHRVEAKLHSSFAAKERALADRESQLEQKQRRLEEEQQAFLARIDAERAAIHQIQAERAMAYVEAKMQALAEEWKAMKALCAEQEKRVEMLEALLLEHGIGVDGLPAHQVS